MPKSSLEASFVRKLLIAISSASVLMLSLAGTALGWHAFLDSDCAPDENSYAWLINLSDEDHFQVDFWWDDKTGEPDFTINFEDQDGFAPDTWFAFTTPRGGSTLFIEFEDAKDSEAANGQLCPEPGIDIEKTNDTMDNEPANTVTDNEGDGEAVTYTFKVTNTGDFNLTDVEVVDSIFSGEDEGEPACEPLVPDPANDAILNPGETWTWTCTRTLPEGEHDNEACVYADVVVTDTIQLQDAREFDVSACDNNEVTVVGGGTGGETGTPPEGGSIPDTAAAIPSQSSPIATLAFAMLLVSSLGALAYANVRAARRR
jgi:hypothetical protein